MAPYCKGVPSTDQKKLCPECGMVQSSSSCWAKESPRKAGSRPRQGGFRADIWRLRWERPVASWLKTEHSPGHGHRLRKRTSEGPGGGLGWGGGALHVPLRFCRGGGWGGGLLRILALACPS